MNPVSEKQLDFIRSLASERTLALADNPSILQRTLETSRDASALIDTLKALPLDPREVDPTEQVRIEALRGALDTLSPRDREFALSLIRQWEDRGRLSERQWPHVDRLSVVGDAPTVDLNVGDIVRIGNGEYVVIVQRRDRTGSYAKRLTEGGTTVIKGDTARARTGEVVRGDEKAEIASHYGHASTQCCFCSRSLTKGESTTMGYGPDCANKYGLPWGTLTTA
jgi:hypothetical protein